MGAERGESESPGEAPGPRIVLFTRWPAPGVAKTRLIPALGAAGAAALHRRLTERTIATIGRAGLRAEVRTTGAETQAFEAWLGPGVDIIDQGGGNLGERLARAAETGNVILLGADAPDLRPEHLRAAVEALSAHPAVIGPASDGGYWLLGLRAPAPYLFATMPWGADTVCRITLDRLAVRGVQPVMLEVLADCDRPADLARWPELTP